ncbi:unnamed protein product, partial [Prorocentrum cordatum]
SAPFFRRPARLEPRPRTCAPPHSRRRASAGAPSPPRGGAPQGTMHRRLASRALRRLGAGAAATARGGRAETAAPARVAAQRELPRHMWQTWRRLAQEAGAKDAAERAEAGAGGASEQAETKGEAAAEGSGAAAAEEASAPEGAAEEAQAEEETQDAKLKRELAELQEEVKAKKHDLLMTLADFENNKKRFAKERETRKRTATVGFARQMVDTYSTFEELLVAHNEQSSEAGQALLEGVVLTRDLYRATLEKFDLKPLSVEPGEPFVAARHECASDDDKPSGAVAEMVQAGWIFEPRGSPPVIIKKAQVKPEKSETPPAPSA